MTPLAHRIVKQLTLPKRQREPFHDEAGVLSRMADVHCFEVSEAVPAIEILRNHIYKSAVLDQRSTFLPAPKSWIECKTPDAWRIGYFLEQAADGHTAKAAFVLKLPSAESALVSVDLGSLSLTSLTSPDFLQHAASRFSMTSRGFQASYLRHGLFLLATLGLINTPRIIGRRQHMPHRGLEKRLVGALGMQGKFPLHAWTEIKLEVTPPKDMSQDGVHEAHLTGQRALHFCRAHLRVKMGRLEIVRSHWRGDASLGIKRSRYKLVA